MCLVCGEPSEVGCLCAACAKQVSAGDIQIPELIHSTNSGFDAEAWLVDKFGQAHAVAPRTVIGRRLDGASHLISVLTVSVSKNHVELRLVDGAWTVRDTNSRNHVFIDGAKVANRATIRSGAILRLANVSMWFLTKDRITDDPTRLESFETRELDTSIDYHLTTNEAELRLTGNPEGGALLQLRDNVWQEGRRLPLLDYQLMRVLCARAIAEADSDDPSRGCVTWKQIVNEVDFKTRYANSENVRGVVYRLRGVLEALGVKNIIDNRPGRGYRLTCGVTVFEK